MSQFNKIKNALSPLNIPTRRLTLSKKDTEQNYDQYIIVTEYNQQGALYADDVEVATAHSIQISLFTRLNYIETAKQIKGLLALLGFSRTNEYEFFEDETDYYHKVIRFSYTEERESEI